MTDTTDTARKLFAEYAVLDEYDRTRSRMGHDYGSGQRGAELMRRRRSLRMIGLDVELDEIEHPSKEELSAAFERVGRPKLRRAEQETFRKGTPATSRTLKAWAMVERYATGARIASHDAAGEPRPTGFVIGTIVEHVDSGMTGTVVSRAIAARSAGGALMQRVKWDHGFKQSDEGSPTFVSRLREHETHDDAGIELPKSELTRRQEKRAAREAAKTERRKMLDGLAVGDLVRVTGSREGGTEQSYTGTIRRLGSSGTVLIDDAEQTDGAGTPTLHYCSSGTVEKIEPSSGAGTMPRESLRDPHLRHDFDTLASAERDGESFAAWEAALAARKRLAADTLAPGWLRAYAERVVDAIRRERSSS